MWSRNKDPSVRGRLFLHHSLPLFEKQNKEKKTPCSQGRKKNCSEILQRLRHCILVKVSSSVPQSLGLSFLRGKKSQLMPQWDTNTLSSPKFGSKEFHPRATDTTSSKQHCISLYKDVESLVVTKQWLWDHLTPNHHLIWLTTRIKWLKVLERSITPHSPPLCAVTKEVLLFLTTFHSFKYSTEQHVSALWTSAK